MDDTTGEYLRAHQVAKLLNISKRTVANWQKRRVLPHVKLGQVVLFRRSEIMAVLERFKVEAIPNIPLRRIRRASPSPVGETRAGIDDRTLP